MLALRNWIKRRLGLYDIDDLVVGGNCGCCGNLIKDEIFEKYWRWGLCKSCASGYENFIQKVTIKEVPQIISGFTICPNCGKECQKGDIISCFIAWFGRCDECVRKALHRLDSQG